MSVENLTVDPAAAGWPRAMGVDASQCPECAAMVLHTSPTGYGDRKKHLDWHRVLEETARLAGMFRVIG